VQLSKKALEDGMCVVIGMQSTGGGWVKLREPGQVKQSHHATHEPLMCPLEHGKEAGTLSATRAPTFPAAAALR